MFGSYGFILYILYIPVHKSLRPYGYWWSEVDNQKKYLTQRRKERRGKTLQSLINGSILTIALCVSASLR